MKIPFWLLITLIIIVTYLFYLVLQCNKTESFINMSSDFGSMVKFETGDGSSTTTYIDPQAIKLTDLFYVFPNKGNLLQLAPNDDAVRPTDSTNGSIENIKEFIIHDRDFNVASTTIQAFNLDSNGDKFYDGTNSNGSIKTQMVDPLDESGNKIDSYKSFSVNSSISGNVEQQVFYIPYGGLTFVHTIAGVNTADESHKMVFIPGNYEGNHSIKDFKNQQNAALASPALNDVQHKSNIPTLFNSQKFSNSSTINQLTLPITTYRIHQYVYYNMLNGDLIVNKEIGKLAENNNGTAIPHKWAVYSRYTNTTDARKSVVELELDASGNPSEYTPTSGTFSLTQQFGSSFAVADVLGGNIILYIIAQGKTTIAVLKKLASGDYKNTHIIRFNGTNINSDFGSSPTEDTGSTEESDPLDEEEEEDTDSDSDSESEDETTLDEPNFNSNMSDYYKWYWYWNSSGNLPVHFSEDYMLKTQVVPPVCPSCPSCPTKGGCCTNCGGNGGDGTKSKDGKSMVDSKSNDQSELGSAYGKTLDTASDLLKSAGSGVTGLTQDVIGLTKDAVTGTADLAKDTVTGTVGLARETAGGAVDLTKDTISGTLNVAEDVIDATGNVAQETADVVKSLGSGPLRSGSQTGTGYTYGYGMNTNQGYGTQTPYGQQPGIPRGPLDPYTYNGKLKQRPSSDYLPRTADFSKFSK